MSEAKPRVAICIPSGRTWEGGFGFAVFCLGVASCDQVELLPMTVRGHDTSEARNKMVLAALDHFDHHPMDPENDWILWIDADMDFPADSLLRLLKHNVDAVGADYRLRNPPYPKIGLKVNPDDPLGEPLQLTPEDDAAGGLAERAVLGLGLMLVRAKIFRLAPGPWFARTWNPKNARPGNPFGMVTEDCLFSAGLRARGFTVWCDLDLSAHVLHIAEISVPWEFNKLATRGG